jgi:hypothetical protein
MDLKILETASGVLTKREVKTPMDFYSRIVWVILALIVAPLYSRVGEPYQSAFPIVGIILFVAVLAWVGFLNYTDPGKLLYGAETHFEKWRMETERKEVGSGKSLSPSVRSDDTAERLVGS